VTRRVERSRIFVAGHRGLVGSALARRLSGDGHDLVVRSREALDLRVQPDVARFFAEERPDTVYLAAARVGGVLANRDEPADFLFSNLAIQTHVLHESWRSGVSRLLFLGSSCVYPREAPVPIREEALLTGPLEPTNEAYAVAKISGLALCSAYARQYGCDFRAVMPTNLFGPGDNYDLSSGHFLAAMIRKCHLAKLCEAGDEAGVNRDEALHGTIPAATCASLGLERVDAGLALGGGAVRVEVWGSGKPLREYLWVDDLAEACVMLMQLSPERYRAAVRGAGERDLNFLNVGSGHERSVAEIAALVRRIVGVRSPIVLDPAKPDGVARKAVDSTRVRALGWMPRMRIEDGIECAYRHYCAKAAST
jgi:GDP-L-fucose synthase